LLDAESLLDSISATELSALVAFDRLEGIDDSKRWQRIEAILAIGFSTLANLSIAKGDKLEPDYFIPPAAWSVKRNREPDAASVNAQKALIRQVVALHNSRR
jgi:hypothetical protein